MLLTLFTPPVAPAWRAACERIELQIDQYQRLLLHAVTSLIASLSASAVGDAGVGRGDAMKREMSALLKLTGLVLQIATFVIATKGRHSFHESAAMPSFARSGSKQKSKRYERGSFVYPLCISKAHISYQTTDLRKPQKINIASTMECSKPYWTVRGPFSELVRTMPTTSF